MTADVGKLRCLWENGEDSILVPVGDPDAMGAVVIRALEEPGLVGNLLTKALCKAERFDRGTVLPIWDALFVSLTVVGSVYERTFR